MTTDLHESIDSAILKALSPKHGRTCLEVMAHCPKGFTHKAIKDRLKAMAEAGEIRCEVVGEPDHQVKEYRSNA